MERWVGKVALVTGASSGIGAAIAAALAREGMKVVGLARRVEKVEENKTKLGKVKGELFPLKGDISKEEDIKATFDWIKKKFGTIHVLVNNAGVSRMGGLLDGKSEHFREILDTNVLALTLCTQQALKLMQETNVNDGHIIHINSIAGHYVPWFGKPLMNVYAGSKHAVTALTETLRQELRFHNLKTKVTSISPGSVKTEIAEAKAKASGEEIPEEMRKIMKTIPILLPEDLANSAIYVLSTPPHVQVHELIIKPVGEAW